GLVSFDGNLPKNSSNFPLPAKGSPFICPAQSRASRETRVTLNSFVSREGGLRAVPFFAFLLALKIVSRTAQRPSLPLTDGQGADLTRNSRVFAKPSSVTFTTHSGVCDQRPSRVPRRPPIP